jgi:glyoxylase-like metal-dependent hydrolase (beta-lactamase superfamily II)
MAGQPARQVLAVRYGSRAARRSELFLNYHRYGEPDAPVDLDYYFWVIRQGGDVFLVDTGFAPEAGRRRRRTSRATPAQVLPGLGLDPREVTAVVVSHAHWDHIGNLRQFPRAELVMAEAEYDFWASGLAARGHFAAEVERDELALLRTRRAAGTLTLFTGQATLAPGLELIEVGGHTPGQLIAAVTTPAAGTPADHTSADRTHADNTPAVTTPAAGTGRGTGNATAVLAADALHFYEEVERDRPFAICADLAAMYRAYDTLAQLGRQPATSLVAGHDPQVSARFVPWSPPAGAAPLPDGVSVADLTRPQAVQA